MQQIISMELRWNCSSLLVIRTHTTKASDRHTLDWRALSWIKTSLCWRICGTSARINNQKQPGLMMVHVFTSWTDDDGTHVHFLDWWWYMCSLPCLPYLFSRCCFPAWMWMTPASLQSKCVSPKLPSVDPQLMEVENCDFDDYMSPHMYPAVTSNKLMLLFFFLFSVWMLNDKRHSFPSLCVCHHCGTTSGQITPPSSFWITLTDCFPPFLSRATEPT